MSDVIQNIKCPYCDKADLEPYESSPGRYYAKSACGHRPLLTTHKSGNQIVVDAASRTGRTVGMWGEGKTSIRSVRYNPEFMAGKTAQQVVDDWCLTNRLKKI